MAAGGSQIANIYAVILFPSALAMEHYTEALVSGVMKSTVAVASFVIPVQTGIQQHLEHPGFPLPRKRRNIRKDVFQQPAKLPKALPSRVPPLHLSRIHAIF